MKFTKETFSIIKYSDGDIRYFRIIDLFFIQIPFRIKDKKEIEKLKGDMLNAQSRL